MIFFWVSKCRINANHKRISEKVATIIGVSRLSFFCVTVSSHQKMSQSSNSSSQARPKPGSSPSPPLNATHRTQLGGKCLDGHSQARFYVNMESNPSKIVKAMRPTFFVGKSSWFKLNMFELLRTHFMPRGMRHTLKVCAWFRHVYMVHRPRPRPNRPPTGQKEATAVQIGSTFACTKLRLNDMSVIIQRVCKSWERARPHLTAKPETVATLPSLLNPAIHGPAPSISIGVLGDLSLDVGTHDFVIV